MMAPFNFIDSDVGFFVADDFPSVSSNSYPLSHFLTYHTYKIKDKSKRNHRKRSTSENQRNRDSKRTEILLAP